MHQQTRQRNRNGAVIAEHCDYRAVYGLVVNYIQEGVEATVPSRIREVVAIVAENADGDSGLSLPRLAADLKLDKSSASRRARAAADLGYLKNLEDRKGRPARYVLGDALPEYISVLPSPDEVTAIALLQGKQRGDAR